MSLPVCTVVPTDRGIHYALEAPRDAHNALEWVLTQINRSPGIFEDRTQVFQFNDLPGALDPDAKVRARYLTEFQVAFSREAASRGVPVEPQYIFQLGKKPAVYGDSLDGRAIVLTIDSYTYGGERAVDQIFVQVMPRQAAENYFHR